MDTRLKENLESVGVNIVGVETFSGEPTGQAYIAVDEEGENSIILIAGTNGMVTKEIIKKNLKKMQESDIIIMQLEIPFEVVEYVKDLAKELGKTVIVDRHWQFLIFLIRFGEELIILNQMRQNYKF